jgi:hypothetical protein
MDNRKVTVNQILISGPKIEASLGIKYLAPTERPNKQNIEKEKDELHGPHKNGDEPMCSRRANSSFFL